MAGNESNGVPSVAPTVLIKPNKETFEAKILQDGDKVIFVINGKGMTIPWQIADQLGRGLLAKARQAEEVQNSEQVIRDNAILMRAGSPVGLSSNPDIISETVKEAVSGDEVRRYMPGGVKSKSVIYAPTVRNVEST